jgi:hypothetical protein
MAEISANEGGFQGKNYGSPASQGQLTKLEGLCEKFINSVFNDDSLADCPKLGAWQNRSAAIFEDLVLMKKVCIKQASQPDQGGNDNNYGGKPDNKPVYKPPATTTQKPTPKPVYKPTKKPNKKPYKKPNKKPNNSGY